MTFSDNVQICESILSILVFLVFLSYKQNAFLLPSQNPKWTIKILLDLILYGGALALKQSFIFSSDKYILLGKVKSFWKKSCLSPTFRIIGLKQRVILEFVHQSQGISWINYCININFLIYSILITLFYYNKYLEWISNNLTWTNTCDMIRLTLRKLRERARGSHPWYPRNILDLVETPN